jgi:hypothetical protein
MVETSVKPVPARRWRWRTLALALLAVAFIVAMVLTGSLPETRQLAKFEPRGVLMVSPEQVRRVELTIGEHTATFVRAPNQRWVRSGSQEAATDELIDHLNLAVLVLHTSGPVRVMSRDDYRGVALQEFGLEWPRYSVTLSDAQGVLLEARFGAHNPQEMLQYVQLKGRDEVYLLSRFVGQAWEHIWEHIAPKTGLP